MTDYIDPSVANDPIQRKITAAAKTATRAEMLKLFKERLDEIKSFKHRCWAPEKRAVKRCIALLNVFPTLEEEAEVRKHYKKQLFQIEAGEQMEKDDAEDLLEVDAKAHAKREDGA